MNLPGGTDFSNVLTSSLPAALLRIVEQAAGYSLRHGQRLYLVGGWVRDALLGLPGSDLDLVLEGDGPALALQLAQDIGVRPDLYPRFKTAALHFEGFTIDIATARQETYPSPGSLPVVEQGSLQNDLKRRDFSINSMAAEVHQGFIGPLIDPLGGYSDLKQGFIRILHPASFQDDATRILRAVRYEQRFDFKLEPATLDCLDRDRRYLNTISADRLFYEFECILSERIPEKVLARASDLSVLDTISPGLVFENRHRQWFASARRINRPEMPGLASYLALMCLEQPTEAVSSFIKRLNLPPSISKVVLQAYSIRQLFPKLASDLCPSDVFCLLKAYQPESIRICLASSPPVAVRKTLLRYLNKWQFVKPLLNGDDLIQTGVRPGPQTGMFLRRLRDARLNGYSHSRRDELELVHQWLASNH